jgi:hypothetical protein
MPEIGNTYGLQVVVGARIEVEVFLCVLPLNVSTSSVPSRVHHLHMFISNYFDIRYHTPGSESDVWPSNGCPSNLMLDTLV